MRVVLTISILPAAIGIILCFSGEAAFASEPIRSGDETVLRNVARKRLYPGGRDEEPLKVQAQLPILKTKSNVEEEEPPPPDEVD